MEELNLYKNWKPPDTPVIPGFVLKPLKRPAISFLCVLADLAILPILIVKFVPVQHVFEFIVLYLLCRLKQISIWAILFYQKYAPEHVRRSCVFEPSCSEYMKQSIVEYGFVAGGVNGCKRLLRCKAKNRGTDEF